MKLSFIRPSNSVWNWLSVLSLVGTFLLIVLLVPKKCSPKIERELTNPFVINHKKPFLGDYDSSFSEDNNYHISSALKMGIPPLSDTINDKRFRGLDLISSTSTYQVEKLTHSIPYLVADAHRLLNYIAYDFQQALKARNLPPHLLVVTSLTRTQESQQQLSKRNVNAAEKSAHCFATSMDISWRRFVPLQEATTSEVELKKVLAAILKQYTELGFCYVKHECKQACFHITVANPIPEGHIPSYHLVQS